MDEVFACATRVLHVWHRTARWNLSNSGGTQVLDRDPALGQNRATMAYANLRDFIGKLEKENRLTRVSAPVSTHLEMTKFKHVFSRSGGPAVLFENVVDENGSPQNMPVLTNLFGTVERVSVEHAEITGRTSRIRRAVGLSSAASNCPAVGGKRWRCSPCSKRLWQ